MVAPDVEIDDGKGTVPFALHLSSFYVAVTVHIYGVCASVILTLCVCVCVVFVCVCVGGGVSNNRLVLAKTIHTGLSSVLSSVYKP